MLIATSWLSPCCETCEINRCFTAIYSPRLVCVGCLKSHNHIPSLTLCLPSLFDSGFLATRCYICFLSLSLIGFQFSEPPRCLFDILTFSLGEERRPCNFIESCHGHCLESAKSDRRIYFTIAACSIDIIMLANLPGSGLIVGYREGQIYICWTSL